MRVFISTMLLLGIFFVRNVTSAGVISAKPSSVVAQSERHNPFGIHGNYVARRHHQLSSQTMPFNDERSPVKSSSSEDENLSKRQRARFTLFSPGLGACGGHNSDNDFIVALNSAEWNGGTHCHEKITLVFNGRSTVAEIVDECTGCPPRGLDLSTGLFASLANTGLGVIFGDWTYGSEYSKDRPHHTNYSAPTNSHIVTSTKSESTVKSALASLSTATTTATATTHHSKPTSPTKLGSPQFLNDANTLMAQLGSLLEAAMTLG